jgi:hypothetical protein
MSQKEFQRVKVIENAAGGRLSVREASRLLQLRERQVQRLKRRYRPDSVDWVQHGNRGRGMPWAVAIPQKQLILTHADDHAHDSPGCPDAGGYARDRNGSRNGSELCATRRDDLDCSHRPDPDLREVGVSVPTFSRSWNQNDQKLTHAGRIPMTSAALASTSAAISTRAARLAIVAIVSYQILLIALIFLRPDLAPSWHTISEWAIGPYGWIMSAAFLISALSYAALFVMRNRTCMEPWAVWDSAYSSSVRLARLGWEYSQQILCRCTSRYPPGAHCTSYSAQASWCSCHFQRCLSTSVWHATTKRPGAARRVLLWTAG